MRNWHISIGTLATMVLTMAFVPIAWSQEGRSASGREDKNQPGNRDQQKRSSGSLTIRGVVAGITAEGEMFFDYRQNRAIAAEAAYVTVVGSPMKSEKGEAERGQNARSAQREGQSARRRHDVYIIWMSPRTKVCECSEDSAKSNRDQSSSSSKGEKKECSLDKLEVGDYVEVQFQPRDESNETHVAHQTERMREKHGRHRTHVGIATEVTILGSQEGEHSGSGSQEKEHSK